MTECAGQFELLGKVVRAQIEANFDGGDLSSDAGEDNLDIHESADSDSHLRRIPADLQTADP